MRNTIWKICKNLLIIISIFLIWDISARYTNPVFIPSPIKVFSNLLVVAKNGQLFIAIRYSFLRITLATIISGLISIPIGLITYNIPFVNEIINPVISVLRFIPVTAFYPLLIMWFGIDELMKIVFLFIATFVYMMPSVMLALDEVNPDLIDTGKTIGMNKLQVITLIQIPAIMPSLMNSFIMMYGIGWTYIAVAETVNAKYGLGYMIQQSSSRGRTDIVFMAIIVIVIFSILFDTLAKKAVRTIFKWRYLDDNLE